MPWSLAANTRHCKHCGVVHKSHIGPKGYNRCRYQRMRKKELQRVRRYREDPAVKQQQSRRHKEWMLLKLYGLSIENFEQLFEQQKGKCAICGRQFNERTLRPHVDHCHKTKQVRGLLCRKCNPALGSFNDDPRLLRAALRYLRIGTKLAERIDRFLDGGKS